jgi:hypothetical protein
MQLVAASASRLLLNPAHDRIGVATAAEGGARDQVVDVEVPSPGEALAEAESADRRGVGVARLERRDDPIAGGPLGVDPPDERLGRAKAWAELEQR